MRRASIRRIVYLYLRKLRLNHTEAKTTTKLDDQLLASVKSALGWLHQLETEEGDQKLSRWRTLIEDISLLRTAEGLADFKEAVTAYKLSKEVAELRPYFPSKLIVVLELLEPLILLHERTIPTLERDLEPDPFEESVLDFAPVRLPEGAQREKEETQEELDALVDWSKAKPNPLYIPPRA